ncbi:ABC transporter ATP-binding protein [Cohnella nanjingensis]|uniref:ABC transporter ATP-binding protein n=2 Tax=Cohnella nanjingensis TaxID=1387779 RepID=A0A7X0RPY5_9BACL|nr:ABC transporter ATP-binding protein [Cohnella nanjingensis]
MYTDRCTISRPEKVKDPVTKETKEDMQPVLVAVPCRLSQSGLAKNDQSDAQNDIRYEAKLFIAPELEIRQGDQVDVIRGVHTASGWEPLAEGRTWRFQAGEPFPPYSTHQEVSLQRRDWA